MLSDPSRWLGAAAGLGPTGVIGAWWAWSGVGVPVTDAIVSLGLLAAIAMSAGWIAGPLAASVPGSLARAAIGYAIAVIATTSVLSIVQAGTDVISAGDITLGGLVAAVVGRALIGLAGTAYLILPALAFGAIWAGLARMLLRAAGRDPMT